MPTAQKISYRIVQKTLPHPAPAYPPLPVRRFTVDEYHRLIQTGILRSGEPVELIEGWILPKMPTNPTHASVVRRLDRWLQKHLADDLIVSVQQPITTDTSEPEPDLTVCRGPEGRYFTAHPRPEDIHILIEVSDTTIAYDRGEKLRMYARANVSIYWIVDLEQRMFTVYTRPRAGRHPAYQSHQDYPLGTTVPVVIGKKTIGSIPVNDIVPPGG